MKIEDNYKPNIIINGISYFEDNNEEYNILKTWNYKYKMWEILKFPKKANDSIENLKQTIKLIYQI